MDTRVCARCKSEKCVSMFNYRGKSKYLQSYCKECAAMAKRESYLRNIDKIRKKYADNSEEIKQRSQEWRDANKDKCSKRNQRYRIRRNGLSRRRYRSDSVYRARVQASCRLNAAIKNGYSEKSKIRGLIGLSWESLIKRIGNRPSDDHHIDHICPLSQAKTVEEVLLLQHYTNIQWLTSYDNMVKRNNKTDDAEMMCRLLLSREWIA